VVVSHVMCAQGVMSVLWLMVKHQCTVMRRAAVCRAVRSVQLGRSELCEVEARGSTLVYRGARALSGRVIGQLLFGEIVLLVAACAGVLCEIKHCSIG